MFLKRTTLKQLDTELDTCHTLQMEVLRAALQQTVEKWGCLKRSLREASLHTTRVHCSLQHQPLFSLKQAEGYMDLLQVSESTESHIPYNPAFIVPQ